MSERKHKRIGLLWLGGSVFLLIIYWLWGTGCVSDDFVDLVVMKREPFPEFLVPKGNFRNVPVGHFTHHIWFRFFKEDGVMIDLMKIFWTTVSVALLYRFLRLFQDSTTALIMSLLFAFYPSHDSIPFWYAPSGHLLSLAVFLEAYVQDRRGRPWLAVFLASVASFMVYGSTPTALALCVLCLSTGHQRGCLVLGVPNLLYVFYFLWMSHFSGSAPSRFLEPLNLNTLLKNFALQLLTFLDAVLGPSLWLKIYYSMQELSLLSVTLLVALLALLVKVWKVEVVAGNRHLLAALSVLAVASFVMFSFTGRYPQLAFNLGNRSTFWSSFLVVYCLVVCPAPRWIRIGVVGLLFGAIFGISDHWRAWSSHQLAVMSKIRASEQLERVGERDVILVSGNQYSALGPFAHIEFLSEDWVVTHLWRLAGKPCRHALPLNRNYYVENGVYRSRKKNRLEWRLDDIAWLYDSEQGVLSRLDDGTLGGLVVAQENPVRHWSQMNNTGLTKRVKSMVYYLMPRLEGRLDSQEAKKER